MRSLAGVPETWWLLTLPSPLPLSSPDARSLAVPARGALPGNVGRNDHHVCEGACHLQHGVIVDLSPGLVTKQRYLLHVPVRLPNDRPAAGARMDGRRSAGCREFRWGRLAAPAPPR